MSNHFYYRIVVENTILIESLLTPKIIRKMMYQARIYIKIWPPELGIELSLITEHSLVLFNPTKRT